MTRTITRRKTCKGCGKGKLYTDFYPDSTYKDGRTALCKVCFRRQVDAYYARCHEKVFDHYGWKCVCCGATRRLTLDHKNGNGPEHKSKLFGIHGRNSGARLYSYLVRNNFPAECEPGGEFELQVLCMGCNSSKQSGDHCRIHCPIPNHDHYRHRPRKPAWSRGAG